MKTPRLTQLSRMKILSTISILALLPMFLSCSTDDNKVKSQSSSLTQMIENTNTLIDKMPEFPGGKEALTKFMIDNLKYPESAKNNGIEGQVMVTFIVTKSGKPDKIKVTQKANELLDAEAVRVISIMPDWTPGETDGATVDVEMTLPVNFQLEVIMENKIFPGNHSLYNLII